MPTPDVLEGVLDDTQRVAEFFDEFPWERRAPDAETLSAEEFLGALGD